MTVCAGSRLGPYEILAALGAGGMGEVYRARDTRLGRDVAIKVLSARFATDPERLRRFEREARAVAALDHPNILAIHDVGTHEGSPYIVTELLEGESLQARLKTGALPPRKAIELAVQLCSGLAAAHEKGIIHRDLKPANVFIRKDGHAKIVDFGLAKLVEGRLGPEEVAQAPTLTEGTGVGIALGTAGYMAPEQVRGEAIDYRADIFALGCVLYEMLTCAQPFAGATAADSVVAILTKDPRPLSQCHVDLPRGLEAVVLRCLEKRPEERFDTARDIAFALRAFSQPEAAAGATPPRWGSPLEGRPSIAVLPFVNLSADPEQEYFCDGMAEEIINALAHIHGLRVVARTSSFAFKSRAEDVREIGAQLQVATLLEGSVRRWGDRLRITAQLINVADGSHLWSERYDRRLEDVFAIQEEIALAIVENLEVRLLGRERAAITRRATGNLDAHSAFLRGQYYWNTFTPEGFARSRQNFEEAVRIDPNYAPALSGLGMWYVSQAFWADYPSENARQAASAACERALSSDPEFWAAHAVRGNVLAFFERQWTEAEASLRRGVLYGPGQAQSHFNLAALLVVRRRWDEMAQEARLALRLDPLSAPNCAWNACWLGVAGYRDEADAEIEKILAIAPNHWLPHWVAAMQALGSAHLDKARSEAEKAVGFSGGASMAVTVLACVCQELGDASQMGELEERLRDRACRGHVAPTAFAWIADARRDVPAAVRWLEHAAATHDPLVCFYRTIPAGLLSGDPAIESVLKKFDL